MVNIVETQQNKIVAVSDAEIRIVSVGVQGATGATGVSTWGGIAGTLSTQTDLQSALNSKVNASALATVATTGAYSDLTGKPTLGSLAAQSGTFSGTSSGTNTGDQIILIDKSYFNASPVDGTTTLYAYAAQAFMIDAINGIKTASGTMSVAIKINGVNVTGLSAISVTSTAQNVSASGANMVAIGDVITAVFSSSVSPVNLQFAFKGHVS